VSSGRITPSGVRGVLNDAISIYFADATLASAFVARWCVGSKVAPTGGVFQFREDEPEARSAPDRIRHPEDGEIASASGTRDHRWPVITRAGKPAGDLKCAFSDWY
jgi:hypothetical protein